MSFQYCQYIFPLTRTSEELAESIWHINPRSKSIEGVARESASHSIFSKAWNVSEVPRNEEQSQIITNLVPHHRIIFETLAALGCRPGEICALKKRDLVGGRVYIQRAFDNAGHLKETKSNKIQCKMLPPDLYARLGELCRDRLPEAFIFSGQRGAPYRPVYLTQLWKTAARKAEIPVPLYVGTRHSFATQRWEEIQKAGADKLASEMGHASAGTTFSHYVRTVPNLSPVEKKPS